MKRESWLHVRVTEDGRKAFTETAEALGISLSEAVRRAMSDFVAKHRRKQ